jgi:hypothetical protein
MNYLNNLIEDLELFVHHKIWFFYDLLSNLDFKKSGEGFLSLHFSKLFKIKLLTALNKPLLIELSVISLRMKFKIKDLKL